MFPLAEKYQCPVCKDVLRYPVQFEECGHRVCSSCFPSLLRWGYFTFVILFAGIGSYVFNRGVLPEMELAVLSVILVIYWHWDSVKKQLQYCMSIPRKYDWFVGYFVVYHLKMLHNKYIHVLNTCTHAAGFDAQFIFHCCFAYRVEPRCPIDQIQINKEAVSKIEFHISLVSQERYCNQSIERYLFLGTPVLYWTEYIAGIGRYRRSQYMQWQLLSFKLVLCSWAR